MFPVTLSQPNTPLPNTLIMLNNGHYFIPSLGVNKSTSARSNCSCPGRRYRSLFLSFLSTNQLTGRVDRWPFGCFHDSKLKETWGSCSEVGREQRCPGSTKNNCSCNDTDLVFFKKALQDRVWRLVAESHRVGALIQYQETLRTRIFWLESHDGEMPNCVNAEALWPPSPKPSPHIFLTSNSAWPPMSKSAPTRKEWPPQYTRISWSLHNELQF